MNITKNYMSADEDPVCIDPGLKKLMNRYTKRGYVNFEDGFVPESYRYLNFNNQEIESEKEEPFIFKGIGEFLWKLVKGIFTHKGKYYGKTVIDDEEVHLADSDYIGNVLKKNGGKPGAVNLGAYVPKTDEIFVSPDSIKYGYPVEEIFYHELEHKYNPRASEWEADESALKRLGADG